MQQSEEVKKFTNPHLTINGEPRASVVSEKLKTVWFNTGTRCNLSCENCYIESNPQNDRLMFLTLEDVIPYLKEMEQNFSSVNKIGFTGGEPFINPHFISILEQTLKKGFEVIVLSNAYKSIIRYHDKIFELSKIFGKKFQLRVSFDHYTQEAHEKERGENTFIPTLEEFKTLYQNGVHLSIAGRSLFEESLDDALNGFQKMLSQIEVNLDLKIGENIVIFPEMDMNKDVPEISVNCWSILNKKPQDQMCSTERMIVKRKGSEKPSVLACTLIAYDQEFELGHTLEESMKPIFLNHPFCAQFCVLGGASCSATN